MKLIALLLRITANCGGKRNLESILDHIEGIGPKRRKALWQAFGNLEGIKAASVEELASVPGMNQKTAEAVFEFFRLSKEEKRATIERDIRGS